MRGKLPESVLNRKKTGFDIPTHDWFRGLLRDLLMDTLTPDAIDGDGNLRCARDPRADTRSYGEAHQCRISLMGPADAFPVDEEMEGGDSAAGGSGSAGARSASLPANRRRWWRPLIFLGCIISPPSLMDDVDAVQAQIARNMLQSGDWVTARLDGVAYLEKSPLKYWMMAVSFMIFGVARLGGADSDRACARCCCAG